MELASPNSSTTARALPTLSTRSHMADEEDKTADPVLASVTERLRGARFQQLRDKFIEHGAISFANEEERARLPAISLRTKARTATDRRWDVALQHANRHLITAKERAEAAQGRVLAGYVGAMMSHVGLAAVQEEALIAMCHTIASGPSHIKVLVKSGGMPAVVLAMHVHVQTADLVACWVEFCASV